MSLRIVLILIASTLVVSVPAVAWAAAGDSTGTTDVLFPWVTSGGFSENWLEGLGFVGLGVVGALVTVYFLLGDFLPSMGGKAEYEESRLELADLTQRRDRQIELRERFSRGELALPDERLQAANKLTEDLSAAITQKGQELQRQKRSLLAMGMPIYVLLGGAFAVLFASNGLQAFFIGFGWTGLADRIGLSKELAARSTKREVEVQKLRQDAEKGVKAQGDLEAAHAQIKQLAESASSLARKLSDKA